MNYSKIYTQLVDRAKNEARIKNCGVYYERHHILPKCMGGNDSVDNLVLLTAREHFLCHWLLVRLYPNNKKLSHSFWMMCNKKSKRHLYYTPSSRMYQEAKESFSKNGLTQETRQKMKRPKPVGFGEKISKSLKGKTHSLGRIQKTTIGLIKKINELGHGLNKGTKWSKESKLKHSSNRQGDKNPMYGKTLTVDHKLKFRKKKKKIVQVSLNDQFIKLWDSSKDIYNELGFSQDQIIATCKGRRESFKNYKWSYETIKD